MRQRDLDDPLDPRNALVLHRQVGGEVFPPARADPHIVVQEHHPLRRGCRAPSGVPCGGRPPALQGHHGGPAGQCRWHGDLQRVRRLPPVVCQ